MLSSINLVNPPKNRVVVRVRTEYYPTKHGVATKKVVNYLQRKSVGHNFFQEDVEQCGAEEAIPLITNLYEVKDGVYELVMWNMSRDWETGYTECLDYKLIPYEE